MQIAVGANAFGGTFLKACYGVAMRVCYNDLGNISRAMKG